MKFIDKLSGWIEKFLSYAAFFLLFAVMFFGVEQIISRDLFASVYEWAEEVIIYATLFGVFFVAPLASKYNKHISIDFLVANRTGKTRTICNWFITWGEFVVVSWLVYAYVRFEIYIYNMGGVLLSGLGIPMWLATLSLGIALLFIIFFTLVKIYHLFSGER